MQRPHRDTSKDLSATTQAWLGRTAPDAAVWVVMMLTFAALGWGVLQMQVPVVTGDELAYLGTARWLAGEGAHPRSSDPGLGLLWSPWFWVTSTQQAAYRLALLTNVALLSGAYFLVARAVAPSRQNPRNGDLLAAGLIALPAFTWFTNVAMTETALLFVAAFAFWAISRVEGRAAGLFAAFVIGAAVALQTRALVVIAAYAVASVDELWRCRDWRRASADLSALTSGVLLGAGLTWIFARRFRFGDEPSRALSGEAADLVRIFTPDALGQVAVHAWTHASYVIAATAGLALLGALSRSMISVESGRNGQRPDPSRRARTLAVALLMLGILAVAADTAGRNNVRDLFFGRYLAPWLLPATVLGGQALLRLRRTGVFVPVVLVLAGGLSGLTLAHGPAVLGATHSPAGLFDTPLFGLADRLTSSPTEMLGLAGLIAVAGSTLVALGLRRPHTSFGVLVAATATGAMLAPLSAAVIFQPWSRATAAESRLGEIARHVVPVTSCLAYDVGTLSSASGHPRYRYVYGWSYPRPLLPHDADRSPCDFVLSGDPRFDRRHPGAERLAVEPNVPRRALWRLP